MYTHDLAPLLRARVADWILLVVELAVQVFFMYFCYFNLARCGFRVLDYGSAVGICVKISVIIEIWSCISWLRVNYPLYWCLVVRYLL